MNSTYFFHSYKTSPVQFIFCYVFSYILVCTFFITFWTERFHILLDDYNIIHKWYISTGYWGYSGNNRQQKANIRERWKRGSWKLVRTIWFPSLTPWIRCRPWKCVAFSLLVLQERGWCLSYSVCLDDGINRCSPFLYGGVSWSVL